MRDLGAAVGFGVDEAGGVLALAGLQRGDRVEVLVVQAERVADVGELVVSWCGRTAAARELRSSASALGVGEVGEVLGDDQQRAGDVPGAARPFVQPRPGGRGQQRLPGLVDGDERAAGPRPAPARRGAATWRGAAALRRRGR